MSMVKLIQLERRYNKRMENILRDFLRAGMSVQGISDETGLARASLRRMFDYCDLWHLLPDQSERAKESRRARRGICTPAMASALNRALEARGVKTKVRA